MNDYIFMFVDVVRYSQMKDEDQRDVIAALTEGMKRTFPGSLLKEPGKGLFLATGDGCVSAFLDSDVQRQPQVLISLAIELQRAVSKFGQLRIGFHRGSARPYQDFNAELLRDSAKNNNLAGSALNMAQRVMSLGDPGDIIATQTFVEHFAHERSREDAEAAFRSMGTVRVKHGEEVSIFKATATGDGTKVPQRVATYGTAQKEIFRALTDIRLKVHYAVHKEPRATLETRASLFLFDSKQNQLFLSGFRDGAGVEWLDPVIPARFELDEGPGIIFEMGRRENRSRLGYFELPSPSNRDEWNIEASRVLKIPFRKVEVFRRPAACYLYLSAHFGGHGHPAFGVVCVDLMKPVFKRHEIATRLRRKEGLRGRQLELAVQSRLSKRLDKLERRLQPFLQKLAIAYAVINAY